MVDIDLKRFPWSFKEVTSPSPLDPDLPPIHVGYRVRIDFLIHEDSKTPFLLHLDHFTSQSDLLDNYQMALDCGVTCSVDRCYILVTPTRFSTIYNQIKDYVSKSDLH